MDDSFFSDFNVSDAPVYARKSTPPPPPPVNTVENEPCFSTPSSSLLDTSNENSSAAANSAHPTPSPRVDEGTDEPMEQDASPRLHQPQQHPSVENNTLTKKTKTRNRSRNKRPDGKQGDQRPNVNALLAELEKPNPPLPPPLVASQFPPPPPPPPTLPSSDQFRHKPEDKGSPCLPIPPPFEAQNSKVPEDLVGDNSLNTKGKPDTRKSGKNKKKPVPDAQTRGDQPPRQPPSQDPVPTPSTPATTSASSSQRTTGRIPRISRDKNNPIDPVNNPKGSGDPDPPKASDDETTMNKGEKEKGSNDNRKYPTSHSQHQQHHRYQHQQQQQQQQQQQHREESSRDPSGGTQPSSSSSSSTTAYGSKPPSQESLCLDISSYRFIPDDDNRVAILTRKMRGDPMGRVDLSVKNTKIIHQLPTIFSNDVTGIPLAEAPGASFLLDANDRFMSVADFASEELNTPTVYHTVARRDALVFIIVTRPEGARGKITWDVPTLPLCQDFSNEFISKIYEGDNLHWASTYIRSGRWGKVGTIILSTKDRDALSEFRRQLALHTYRGMSYDTHPKDALTAKADVAILLRSSMKTFKTEMIPRVLFARNQTTIAGSLRVLSTTFHAAEEMSHKGESKEHWRTVDLKGDDQFMRCLRFIPENEPFLLGYDSVQIRGGLRPQENNFAITNPGSKRPWSDFQPASVPLLQDPRNIRPSTQDEDSSRGNKRGRGNRGSRRGRGSRGRRGRP